MTRRFWLLFLLPNALLAIGTLGYYLIEPKYSVFDAFYMTVITLTTVGYGEVHELSTGGRVFTIALLLVGTFTLFYAATEIVRAVVSGEVQHIYGRGLMARNLAALHDHYIVIGYGRMGKHVCREFSRQGKPFVLVEKDAKLLEGFALEHGLTVVGDATSDEVLRLAGVERATALVTVVPHDAENLYITMSARLLNADLFIVARAEAEQTEVKLRRAGADRVVAPHALGGSKIAQAVMRPNVLDFMELATKTGHLEFQIEETVIRPGSKLAGASLTSSRLRQDFGLIVVAIKKEQGEMVYTPTSETVLESGDTLIALGRRAQLDQLDALAGGE